ncbi:hypothetical protein RhiirA4_404440 [Rhizophagus irregularis]|uniref:UBA domain-containing protein n=1 Tax=Rhizophagus irregularis TaxID=588596 RepID=A0A2I1GPB1_9GLOM|nr:hypothetical protein RhiirA4_404440 [Rhizophagus irregularis]
MTEYSRVKQEALNQLLDLGVDEKDAHEVLLKYNNDVNRAADYYFQNFNDDPVSMNNLKSITDWESSTPREDPDKYSYNNNGDTIDLTNSDADLERTLQQSFDDITSRPSSAVENSNNETAVVLYNPRNNSNSQVDDNYTNHNNCEQPIKRLKLDDTTPIGLKSNMNYGFAGPFFLALFHIPIFRLVILAYRPTRDDWGEVEGYWDGNSRGLSDEFDPNSFYHEFKSRPYTLKFMHEFQKLFGFLSLSQRSYGDASSLIEALAFEDKNSWNDWDSVQDFFTKVLDVIVYSSTYHRDLIDLDLDPGIDSLSKHVIPFNRLLKSLGRNESFSNYHYQPEKRDEDVLSIPLVITPSFNTVYAALDKIVYKAETMQKVFFTELAKILIFTLKHRDAFADNNFTSGDSGFHIHKELYMDRYLLNRAEDIEKRWHQLEILKSESEEINQAIRRITDYQGRHNGLDLLKGSIDYFRRKCDKARNNGIIANDAQKTYSFLEGILEKIEQKFKDLIERKEEIEAKIRDIFNTPDMKKVVYRLKAVLGRDAQHHYAYIWVSGGNKTENIFNNNENGNWWRFGDMTVEETSEERALNDTSSLNANVYSLIYVNADVDHNFSNINDIIPSSLKEYMNKDNNHVLNEEVQDNNNYNDNYNYNSYNYGYDNYNNNNDYNDDFNNNYNNNDDDYNNSYYNNDEDVIMRDSSRTEDTHNSDSTTYGGSGYNENNLKTVCEIAENQEKNIVSLHPTINKRFEIFCIKLGQIDLFKSLVHKFYESGCTSMTGTWDEPLSLNTGYLTDPDFKEYVELFDKYKEITLYFTEGLDRVNSDEYRNALAYFKYAINLENDWINDLFVKDKKGESMKLNGEKLRRSKEIDAYAKACLKVDHDGLLSKIRHEPYRTRGLKDGLQTLPYIVAYIGASNCAEDELFKRFRDEFKELIEGVDFTEEQQSLIHNLLEKYTQPEESLELKPSDEVEPDANLCERYEAALKKCSSGLKSYEVPYII